MPTTWRMRAIRYQRRGFPPPQLLTLLLDPKRYLAAEVAALYHERWKIELGYNEVKRVMLAREETTRSKGPRGVAQELWGLAIATTSFVTRPSASPQTQAYRRFASASSPR